MDVLLRDGRVADVAAPGKLRGEAKQNFNAKGCIVTPGFIDLHVHLREPGQAHKETIATGTAAASAGGFTSVCAMPNTVPVNDSAEITRWMQAPERGALVNVFPIAAATVGSMGETLTDFAALEESRRGCCDRRRQADSRRSPYARCAECRRQTQYPCGATCRGHAHDGRLLHEPGAQPRSAWVLHGMPNAAEFSIVERDIALAGETKGHLHVAHLSTREALEAVRRAKKAGLPVTAEVTPHHFTLVDENIGEFNTHYKMNPPLRSVEDRAALIEGIADGTIDAIATDHAPHAFHEKQVEFERAAFGITGLETALAIAVTVLHRHFRLPLWRIVELLSANPARIFGLAGRGSLAPARTRMSLSSIPKRSGPSTRRNQNQNRRTRPTMDGVSPGRSSRRSWTARSSTRLMSWLAKSSESRGAYCSFPLA